MSRRWQRSTDVVWRQTADRVLLLHVDAPEPVVVAGPGPLLWDLLKDPASLEDLAAGLSEAYKMPAERIAWDIEPVLAELTRQGLVRSAA